MPMTEPTPQITPIWIRSRPSESAISLNSADKPVVGKPITRKPERVTKRQDHPAIGRALTFTWLRNWWHL